MLPFLMSHVKINLILNYTIYSLTLLIQHLDYTTHFMLTKFYCVNLPPYYDCDALNMTYF